MLSIVFALVALCEAHVRLIHKPYFSLNIRNAPTPSSDGTLSVAGPCGGSLTWGKSGFSNVTVGDNLTLVFAYNGGHQSATDNMLRIAMVCGRPDSDVALKNTTVATVTSPLVNASDSLTTGYDLWVVIPDIQPGTNGNMCTISALDVRNWGGCIDVMVSPAPTTPTPAGTVVNGMAGKSVAGIYQFGETQCIHDSPGCCCVTGSLNLSHVTGSGNATGQVWLTSCNHTNYTGTDNISMAYPVTLTQAALTLSSMKGTLSTATNTLTFQVAAGAGGVGNTLTMTDDSTTPYYCGLDSKLFASAFTPSGPSVLGQGTGGQGTAAIVLAVLAVLACGAAAWFFGKIITSRLSSMQGKATPINLGFQVLLFVLSAAALGGEWAAGNNYTFSLWSLCGPIGGVQTCMSTADLGSSDLLRTVQAFTVLGMLLAIFSMLICGIALVSTLGEMTFKVLFVFAVMEVIFFFLAMCFFGGYFNDQLVDALSVSWGYGLLILSWMLSMLMAPFAKLATEAKQTSK